MPQRARRIAAADQRVGGVVPAGSAVMPPARIPGSRIRGGPASSVPAGAVIVPVDAGAGLGSTGNRIGAPPASAGRASNATSAASHTRWRDPGGGARHRHGRRQRDDQEAGHLEQQHQCRKRRLPFRW